MILCFGGSQAQVEGRHFQNPLLNVSESFGSLSVLNSKRREIFLVESKYIRSSSNEPRHWDGVPVF